MKRYTLYLGLNDKDTKTQKINTIEAFKIVSDLIARHFDGGTVYDARGIYRHDNGDIVVENTLRIEILEFENSIFEDVKSVVKTLKDVFNQETVAVQIENVQSDLW